MDRTTPTPDPESSERPDRLCAVTRAVLPANRLLRFVAGPDGTVVPDIRNRLPGRGVWVSNARSTLELAIRRKVFGRALKADVIVPPGLVDQVGKLLRADCLQMLALANKAGAIVTGFAKIEGARGTIRALFQAGDGSPAELERLVRATRGRGPGGRDPAVIRMLSSDELALCMGRELVIHASLMAHEVAASVLERANRALDFEANTDGQPPKGMGSDVSGPVAVVPSSGPEAGKKPET